MMINYFNFLKELGYHQFISKSTGESLFIHSYNTYFLISKLINYIPNLTDSDKKKLIIASLLHDHGKKDAIFQTNLKGGHKVTDEAVLEIREIISKLKEITPSEIEDIIYIIKNHHSIDISEIDKTKDRLTRIVSICDNVVSNKGISQGVINLINSLIDNVDYDCFSIDLIEHPFSSYTIGIIDFLYAKSEMEPILFSKNGTIFIKKKKSIIPSLEEINSFLNKIIDENFSSEGILTFNNTNNRIYTNDIDFLKLCLRNEKFLELTEKEVEKRLPFLRKKETWSEPKERVYLLGRICGTVFGSLLTLLLERLKELPKSEKTYTVISQFEEIKNSIKLITTREWSEPLLVAGKFSNSSPYLIPPLFFSNSSGGR